jgi:hypothetical protein
LGDILINYAALKNSKRTFVHGDTKPLLRFIRLEQWINAWYPAQLKMDGWIKGYTISTAKQTAEYDLEKTEET